MRRLRLVTAVLTAALLTGCSAGDPLPDPPPADTPERAASELAAGLTKKDLGAVEFVGASGAEVDGLYQPLVSGMGARQPTVTVGPVTRQGATATAALNTTWAFPGVGQSWSYATEATLTEDGGRWKTSWRPTLVQARLDGTNRLTQSRLDPERGEVLGQDGEAIVQRRPVVRVGLDKSALKPAAVAGSARRLARLVDIDAKAYADRVAAAGPKAFVVAIIFRSTDPGLPRTREVRAIPGALPIQGDQMLAPTRDFARPLIGTVGEATKEIVDASGGTVVPGDQVGLSGLQQRFDEQLRGAPGVRVQLVAAKPPGGATATPSPAPTASAAPAAEPVTVFEAEPKNGRQLETTLSVPLQTLAEKTLAGTRPAAALVAVRPSTGAVLAVANNAATKGQSLGTVGRAAPGSTFKVVSTLALLRAGLNPDSTLTCPTTLSVDGKSFKNYDDYPGSAEGRIDLQTALAQSCNTAFIGQRGTIRGRALAEAAGSLGVGIDYDTGFASFFGSVPEDPTETGRAAALIGQGKIEASPLAMAGVVASVRAGRTVLPHLVAGTKPKAKGKPLTAAEADRLEAMMRSVVTSGSGRVLDGLDGAVIAKTGTAEYGAKEPYRTHAWMIAAKGDLAVAVFVADGESGSRTAGPLLRAFLSGAGRT